MKYREKFAPEKVYEGASYDEVITSMREASGSEAATNKEYISYIYTTMGHVAPTDPEEFIKFLLGRNFLEFTK